MKNPPKELFNLLKQYLQQVFSSRAASGDSGNDTYMQMAADDEERQDIAELCDQIDLYYEERAKFKAADMPACDYLEQEVRTLYRESEPEADEEQVEAYVSSVRTQLDEIMMRNAEKMQHEYNEEYVDDEVEAEKGLRQIEQQISEATDANGGEITVNGGQTNGR